MNHLAEQLDEVMNTVWQMLLGHEIAHAELPEPWCPSGTDNLQARVQISGTWDGALTIECSLKLARAMAEEMFCMEPGEAAPEEIQDALGELVNVVGGNVKALFDGSAKLSLPAVTSGITDNAALADDKATLRRGFHYCGEPVRVGLLIRPT